VKETKAITYGSPSDHLLRLKKENESKIIFAENAIKEISDFLEQYRIFLAILKKVQEALDNEPIEE